jgi:hypothetical protein
MRLGVAIGNRTRDLLHCRRTLYAKSHSNGVIDCHSEPLLVLLQLPHKPRCRKLGIVADTYDTQTRIEHQTRGGPNGELALAEAEAARL